MHVDHASAVKKRDHQKFEGGFALSGLLGSGWLVDFMAYQPLEVI